MPLTRSSRISSRLLFNNDLTVKQHPDTSRSSAASSSSSSSSLYSFSTSNGYEELKKKDQGTLTDPIFFQGQQQFEKVRKFWYITYVLILCLIVTVATKAGGGGGEGQR